jgi:hypothetical protein
MNETKSQLLELHAKQKYLQKSGQPLAIRVYRQARNFSELIALVRAAEDKLIKTGVSDVENRISMLRGIYYGTPWSLDYSLEKSDTRNLGFQIYTASAMPADPRPALGLDLFNALFKSAEVRDGGRSLDFGHTIIGMHARVNLLARSVPLPSGGTGLESSTWLGDLGGGAGMLAFRRIKDPNARANTVFKNSHDYGAPANIEGDLAGFLVACNDTSDPGTLSLTINKGAWIADVLSDYLSIKGDPWKKRMARFLNKYGAKFSTGNVLTNKDSLISAIAGEIKTFAIFYITVRLKDKKLLSTETMIKITQHINGVSNEIATIFVESLLSALKSGSDCIKCTVDPPPIPPDQTFLGWKLFRDAFDVFDKLKP